MRLCSPVKARSLYHHLLIISHCSRLYITQIVDFQGAPITFTCQDFEAEAFQEDLADWLQPVITAMVPLDQELLVMLEERAEMEEARRRERRESRRRQEERQEPGLVLESSGSKENC